MILLPLLTTFVLTTAPITSASAASPNHVNAPAPVAAHAGLPGLPRLRLPSIPRKSGAAPLAAMDRRLRNLVSQQEAWYVDHASYGNNASKLAARDHRRDTSEDLVQVQVLYASKRGWTAIASHPDAPGKSCVVYVGYRETLPLIPRTRAEAHEAVDEGRPACDS